MVEAVGEESCRQKCQTKAQKEGRMKSYNAYGMPGHVDCVTVIDETKIIEIPYDWGLAGPGGAWFILRPAHDVAKEHIEEAKSCLRRSQDVVSISVQRKD